jgi:hypothetical protein
VFRQAQEQNRRIGVFGVNSTLFPRLRSEKVAPVDREKTDLIVS